MGVVRLSTTGSTQGRIIQEVTLPAASASVLRSWRRIYNSSNSTWTSWYPLTWNPTNYFVYRSSAADVGPYVVAAARCEDDEVLARKLGLRWKVMLERAKLLERRECLGREELRDNPVHRFERQPAAREFNLLRYLVERRGTTISRDELLRNVWGYRATGQTRTVDVHVSWLRQKLEDDPKNPRYIVTVPGFGYRLEA